MMIMYPRRGRLTSPVRKILPIKTNTYQFKTFIYILVIHL